MNKPDTLNQLQQLLVDRKTKLSHDSYVNQLYQAGLDQIAKKVAEESAEVIMAAKDLQHAFDTPAKNHLINEASDLLFHLMVLLSHLDCTIDEVLDEIERRLGTSGLAEKRGRQV